MTTNKMSKEREIIEKYIDGFFAMEKSLYSYFGYDYELNLPLVDNRSLYWYVNDENEEDDDGYVRFCDKKECLFNDDEMEYGENVFYTIRGSSKWVYRGEDFTMIVCSECYLGEKLLRIFDNMKEVKYKEEYGNTHS